MNWTGCVNRGLLCWCSFQFHSIYNTGTWNDSLHKNLHIFSYGFISFPIVFQNYRRMYYLFLRHKKSKYNILFARFLPSACNEMILWPLTVYPTYFILDYVFQSHNIKESFHAYKNTVQIQTMIGSLHSICFNFNFLYVHLLYFVYLVDSYIMQFYFTLLV